MGLTVRNNVVEGEVAVRVLNPSNGESLHSRFGPFVACLAHLEQEHGLRIMPSAVASGPDPYTEAGPSTITDVDAQHKTVTLNAGGRVADLVTLLRDALTTAAIPDGWIVSASVDGLTLTFTDPTAVPDPGQPRHYDWPTRDDDEIQFPSRT